MWGRVDYIARENAVAALFPHAIQAYGAPMASGRWKTFQEVVAEVRGRGADELDEVSFEVMLDGAEHCPSPSWDPHGSYRVAFITGDNKLEIQRYSEADSWVKAKLHPPTPQPTKGRTEPNMDFFKTKTRSILFMDVSGWSKLSGHQIYSYVTNVMPKLAAEIQNHDMLNTWGDAIVATFESARDAAESALRIRDIFERTYQHEGMPPDLKCRISLNVGEIIICHNELTNREDIFGHAVHTAARLEPLTAPGHVFCTKHFADTLSGLAGSVPKAWPVGELTLPKKFGQVEACVVTWPNQSDPRPGLKEFLEPADVAKTTAPLVAVVSDKAAQVRITGWLSKLLDPRYGEAIAFSEVDAACKLAAGTAARLIPQMLSDREGTGIKLKDHSEMDFIIYFQSSAVRSRGGWGDREV